MGALTSFLREVYVRNKIVSRHLITYERQGQHSRLEQAIVNTFSFEDRKGLFVHWGAYESGQSWAARNAAQRLQMNCGRFPMLCRGYEFTFVKTAREYLQVCLGIPEEHRNDMIPMYLPYSYKPLLIIDHADDVLKRYGGKKLVLAFQELGMPVLCLVRSWENALDLHNRGCQLLGAPGSSRWTEDELMALYDTLPQEIQDQCRHKRDAIIECAVLSGSPGILWHDAQLNSTPNMHRARLMDAEWKNGIKALNGEDMQGVTGRFPDKDGKFHWDT